MCSLRLLSSAVPKVTGKAFGRKYIALGRILAHWEDIIGSEIAGKAQPVKIHYRRPKTKADKPETTLDIVVSSSDATLLHYQKDLILERINRIFGEQWVTAIRFVHFAANSQGPVKKYKPPLTGEQKKALSLMLEEIDDPDIRERLNSLGEAVIQDQR